MKKYLVVDKIIKPFKKKITVDGDKSISIRWILISSLSKKKSIAYNLPKSEDVKSALRCIKILGSKVTIKKKKCEIEGIGFNDKFKKDLTLNAGNSGTLGRLILGLLVNTKNKIKLVGDNSLSRRDFSRVTKPLSKFGSKFFSKRNKLPIIMQGSGYPKSIDYQELKGSAQCKSTVMLAALKSKGLTKIKAKKSRDHTELLFKHLKIPIKIKKSKKYDFISINGINKISNLNYKIPGDISSSAFFIVLTILSKNSQLLIKNININPSRIGIIKILKTMGAKIKIINKKVYKGEKIGDISVKSSSNLKAIKCPTKYNSSAIDEFLIIFLVAARSKGVSFFNNLSELNQKESPRLIWASKILKFMGIRNEITRSSIRIYGNPNIKINKKITIKNFLKDHRIFMMSVIASLTFGGKWVIHDLNSIRTSFPSFLEKLKYLEN